MKLILNYSKKINEFFIFALYPYLECMIKKCKIEELSAEFGRIPVIDTRSPKEYNNGHIFGAINIPLFSDMERAVVGTAYKRSGREAAVFKGLDITGPKMSGFIKNLRSSVRENRIVVHCWRGGMRSAAMAFLFDLAGFEVLLLEGGYKVYRRFIHETFRKEIEIFILGGKTGTGKTDILECIENIGEQVIDLEKIASHKGSVFGDIGQQEQPTNEQFENNLFEIWRKMDFRRPVWIENESRSIGSAGIPEALFTQMRNSTVINIELPVETRIKRLVNEYTSVNAEKLIEKIEKISKRLGGLKTKESIEAVKQNDFYTAIANVLYYYDKAYQNSLESRDPKTIIQLQFDSDNPEINAKKILDATKK